MLPTHDVDAATAPKVLSDARGDYLLCPHCGTRIAMKRIRIADRDSFKPQA